MLNCTASDVEVKIDCVIWSALPFAIPYVNEIIINMGHSIFSIYLTLIYKYSRVDNVIQ